MPFIAQFDSPNFQFTAVGETEGMAVLAMRHGLAAHGREYDCEPYWWCDAGEENFNVFEIPFGRCARDMDRLLGLWTCVSPTGICTARLSL